MALRKEIKMMLSMIIYMSVALVSSHLSPPIPVETKLLRPEAILHRRLRGLETDTRNYSSEIVKHKNSTKFEVFRFSNDNENNDYKNTKIFNDTLKLNRGPRTTNSKIEIDEFGHPHWRNRNGNTSKSPLYIEISRREDSNDKKYEQKSGAVLKSLDENATGYTVAKHIRPELVTTSSNVNNSIHSDRKNKLQLATEITINPQNQSRDIAVNQDDYLDNIKYTNYTDNKDDSPESRETGEIDNYGKFAITEHQHQPVGIPNNPDDYVDNRRYAIDTDEINETSGTGVSGRKSYYQQSTLTTANYQNQLEDTANNPNAYVDNRGFIYGAVKINETSESSYPERKESAYQQPTLSTANYQTQGTAGNQSKVVDIESVNSSNKTSDNSESVKIDEKGDYQQSSTITTNSQHHLESTSDNQHGGVAYRGFVTGADNDAFDLEDPQKKENYQKSILIANYEHQLGDIEGNQSYVANRGSVNDTGMTSKSGGQDGELDYRQFLKTSTEHQNQSYVTANNKDEDLANRGLVDRVNKTKGLPKSVNNREKSQINSTDLDFSYKRIVEEKGLTSFSSSNSSEQSQNISLKAQSQLSSFRNLVYGTNMEYDQNYNESESNTQEMNNRGKNFSVTETVVITKNEQSDFPLHDRHNNTGRKRVLQDTLEEFVQQTSSESNKNETFDTHSERSEIPHDLNDKIISYNSENETDDNSTMPLMVGENVNDIPGHKFGVFRSSEIITRKFEDESDFSYPSTKLSSKEQNPPSTRKLQNEESKMKTADKEPSVTATSDTSTFITSSNDNRNPANINVPETKVPSVIKRYEKYRKYSSLGSGLLP